MKILASFLALGVALAAGAFADDQLRDAQTELKSQGFFYGAANGQDSNETSSAIRRYQIRNGLEVTGTLNKETLEALGVGAGAAPAPRAPQDAPAPASPPANLRRDQTVEDSDKNFLRREETKGRRAPAPVAHPPPPIADNPPIAPAPEPPDAPSAEFSELFAATPYASAPREVQEATLRRAQNLLASRGIYRDPIDGAPGPATEEALLSFQRSVHLPLSGRLDLETLGVLRLLPGRAPGPLKAFRPEDRPSAYPRVYRGIWIH